MINPNLGKTERAMRLVLGIVLAVWVWNRPGFGLLETVASISSLFLVLNAFYARCYAWEWLGINTCKDDDNCGQKRTC